MAKTSRFPQGVLMGPDDGSTDILTTARPVGTVAYRQQDGLYYQSISAASPSWILFDPSVPTNGTTASGGPFSVPVEAGSGAAGNTINQYFFAPYKIEITRVMLYAATAPTTAGNYTFVFEADDGTDVVASFDLTTLTSGNLQQAPLTDNIEWEANSVLRAVFASDNADLDGAGMYWQLRYRRVA